jgi:hypothetical protein
MGQRLLEVKLKSGVTYGEAVEIGVKSVESTGKQKAKGGKFRRVAIDKSEGSVKA